MRELAASAGRLPDPALVVGVDNLPVEGPDAWSTTADFMTMRNVGLMQEFPRREKRRLERERAAAGVELADAELEETRLAVARETARAWIRRATSDGRCSVAGSASGMASACIFVSISPGSTAITRTPVPSSSAASTRLS